MVRNVNIIEAMVIQALTVHGGSATGREVLEWIEERGGRRDMLSRAIIALAANGILTRQDGPRKVPIERRRYRLTF